jgi:uncharacterized protein (DUF1697 family)
VNVGGTGKLPMAKLKEMCESVGFTDVRTYIASGNVVFNSELTESAVRQLLEHKLHAYAGKPVEVAIRTGAEMAKVLADNPFPDAPGNRVVAIFTENFEPKGQRNEQIAMGNRAIYIHYPDGIADSKLKLATGTARNMNTVAKLVELAQASRSA